MKAIQIIIKLEWDDYTITKTTPFIDLEEDWKHLCSRRKLEGGKKKYDRKSN